MRIFLYVIGVLFLGFTLVCGGCFVGGGLVCNSTMNALVEAKKRVDKRADELVKERQIKEEEEKKNAEEDKKEKPLLPDEPIGNQAKPLIEPKQNQPEPIKKAQVKPALAPDPEIEKRKEEEDRRKEYKKSLENYEEQLQELATLEKRYKETGAKALKAETVEEEASWKKSSQEAYSKYKSLKTELDAKKKALDKEKKKFGF